MNEFAKAAALAMSLNFNEQAATLESGRVPDGFVDEVRFTIRALAHPERIHEGPAYVAECKHAANKAIDLLLLVKRLARS